MRLIFGLVLLAGLGLAGFAVKMAMDYIGAYEAALAEERQRSIQTVPMTSIYLAARPLSYGDRLTEEDVILAPYPSDFLPEGHFAEATPVIAPGDAPRMVLRRIEAHEPLLAVKLSEPGGDAGLASRLKPGERAFAIKVDVSSGVSGFLRPGDTVDIYWTGRATARGPEGGRDGEVTRLIENGVRLIAIDQTAQADGAAVSIARTVTVAATPTQVAALAQAQSTGKLALSLVPLGETERPDGPIEVDARDLLGIEDAPLPAPAPPPQIVEVPAPAPESCSIRTRRGAEVVETPVPCTN